MRPYPSYKESGVEWVGEIPSHWECKRLQYISEIENSGVWGEDEPFDESIPLPIPTTGQLTIEGDWIYDEMGFRYLTKSELEKYRCLEGDIVVVKSSGSSTNIITGKCGYINSDDSKRFGFSNFLLRVRPNELDSKLTYYFLLSNITKQRIERMVSSTTYPNLKVDEYVKSILFIPPLPEQKQIVSFLDHKTQKIDELIEKTEQKIELLKEKRTSLINHCVTKGLNPNVEMKDSGVEWIGNIPKLWEVKKLKHVMILSRGVDLPKEKFSDGIYPVYGSNGIIGYHNEYTTEGPCITVGRSGSVGEVNYVENDFWAHNTTLYVLKSYNNDIRFLYYLLLSIDLKSLSAGSAVGTLNRNYIHKEFVGYPFLNEQIEIASYLDDKTTQIDSLIEKETQRIELLKEYRQSLISEVVTGKIDVREEIV